jgi:calcineurin-like phosphoesterase family protein
MAHNTWFIADTHFGHNNIIQYCDRPFEDIREHDQKLMENWNKHIKGKDTVYHLGDFGWNTDILSKLHGNIHLIRGNHDKDIVLNHPRFLKTGVKHVHILKRNKVIYYLSHYAHRSWPHQFHGSIHLFGHSHGNLEDFGRSTDVGVDRWEYAPVSIEQINEYMADVKIETEK